MQAMQYINDKLDKLNDSENYAICLVAGAALFLLNSCGYGHIRPASQPELMDSLIQASDGYHLSYSGDKDKPGAVLIDPKSDNVTLERGEKWAPIEDKKQLESVVKSMIDAYSGEYPGNDDGEKATLNAVKDKYGNVIGYLFSPVPDSLVRPAGEDSYSVDPVSTVDAENRSSSSGNDSKSTPSGDRGPGGD